MKHGNHNTTRTETDPGSDPTYRQTTKFQGGKSGGGSPKTMKNKQTSTKKMTIMRQPDKYYDQVTKNG